MSRLGLMRAPARPTNHPAPTRAAHRTAAFAAVVLVVSCALAMGASPVARSAPVEARWVMTDLGTLAGRGGSFANGVNNRGQVVGWSWTKDRQAHAFLWESGSMRDLGTLAGYDTSSARAINDRGQIVGDATSRSSLDRARAFLWESETMRDLGTLGGKRSHAVAINNRGQVVGWSTTKDGDDRAFLWENGKMRDIGDFWPADLNDRGQIVGWGLVEGAVGQRPVLWEKGTVRYLRPLGRVGQASGITKRSQIVGLLRDAVSGCSRLTTWTRPSQPADVAAVRRSPCAGVNDDVEAWPAINERGQVVGTSETKDGDRAFLWERGKRFDLGRLPGGPNSYAVAINDQGWIVGASGNHSSSGQRAVLWTPRKVG